MWVDRVLKCPDQGAWLALTRVTAEGATEPLGYVGLPFRESAVADIHAELDRRAGDLERAHYGLGDLSVEEVVDLVLAQLHPDLPAEIDRAP